MILVVREQGLGTLCPQGAQGVFGLATVVPREEALEDLVGLATLDAGLVVFHNAHNKGDFGFPAALGQFEPTLLSLVVAIGLALVTTTLLASARDG